MREPETAEEYVSRVTNLWAKAQKSFLEIGRLLNRARATLPQGTYEAHIQSKLPFGLTVAYQLREAARWAEKVQSEQRLTVEQLPRAYSTVYLLSCMSEEHLDVAQREGLIRPDLRRAELIVWRQRLAGSAIEYQTHLERRRKRLLRERVRIDEELMRIEAELG